MKAVQIRRGLKVHFIDSENDKKLICGHVTPFGFNLLFINHGQENCECLNCRKVMKARRREHGA